MKKLTANLLIASTILGSIVAPIVKAEEGETQKPAKEVDTTAKVEFKANDEGETTPVDPTDPQNPEIVDPENPGGQGGGKGALRIDWAPHFNFGENKIQGGGDFVINATHDEGSPHYFVQVSDLRGLNADWKLNVTASPLKRKDKDEQLLGSYITFTPGTVLNDSVDQEAHLPEYKGVKFAATKIDLGTKEGKENESQTLINAQSEQTPQGTWSLAMETETHKDKNQTEDVTLTIPVSQIKKIRKDIYQATLQWELLSDISADIKGLLPVAK
ncbi:WxL domain-containing protein [Vagococcus lutrae]|uniref:WxL domain-containing protein n=1 Tax=Vagococcus lutrae TaxID=81947 RepID=UPI0023A9F417|nr:WxL domain-containing protein [Vagococcus lutrae]WEB81244.1 WxL domain-containing protein [Vagococcus lutrae]